MDTLRVRAYNVRFGDAILVTVPDRDPKTGVTTTRNMLIDVGNVLNKEGGDDRVFKPALDHVIQTLAGRPVDLYVMTHEHLDHVQGLFYCAAKGFPPGEFKLKVDYAWLTASAAPDYYTKHPEAQKQKKAFLDAYARLKLYVDTAPPETVRHLGAVLANNDPSKTGECVDYLRKLAKHKPAYVYRGCKLAGTHPFKEAKFRIWAPEEDTSDYYKGLLSMTRAAAGGAPAPGAVAGARATPPAGVDASAFFNLVQMRERGFADNILAIDRAANNTSVVFSLHWRGWRLLFPGDAELASWRMMKAKGVLEPVHFLKVSHHGSHNGTPDGDVLEAVLPLKAPDKKRRAAIISTWKETYNGIPHGPTNQKLRDRCTLISMLDDETTPFVEWTFKG
jgi:beta-lactamase superfamily II metal-dependent hydrolase